VSASLSPVITDTAAVIEAAPILECKGLNKYFEIDGKTICALNNIDLTIRPGEFITIVGASGCGKSTLLRLVAGLDTEYTGALLVEGEPVNGIRSWSGISGTAAVPLAHCLP
jgi:sulfonate transport system ATP-binding protein